VSPARDAASRLADMGAREAIKAVSDWPTIPQLNVKGEFVVGCDMVRETRRALPPRARSRHEVVSMGSLHIQSLHPQKRKSVDV
jgi:hypothetical protein